MKKFILTAALAFVSVSMFAQSAKKPVPAADQATAQRVEVLAERQAVTYKQQYTLTDQQMPKIKAACLDFASRVDAPRLQGRQITPAEFQAALDAKSASFKSIMTAEQYKAYDATLDHSKAQALPTNTATKRN